MAEPAEDMLSPYTSQMQLAAQLHKQQGANNGWPGQLWVGSSRAHLQRRGGIVIAGHNQLGCHLRVPSHR